MTSKLDVLAAIATRINESRDTGKIQDTLSADLRNDILIHNDEDEKFDINIRMGKRAELVIHVIKTTASSVHYAAGESVEFSWPHDPRRAIKPSYDSTDAPVCATLMFSADTDAERMRSSTRYLIDAWLDDTNPDHMWNAPGERQSIPSKR